MPAADEEAFPDIQVLRQQRNEAKAILYFDCWILMQKFEFLPPQPASQSLTHTESGRARNATKWRRFVNKDLVSASRNWRRTWDSSVCL